MPMSYDEKCYQLAEHFLPEHVAERKKLAERIQEAIEDFLDENDLNSL